MGIGMTIDPTITFGALINAFVLLVGFIVAFTKLGGRIDLLSLRLASLENTVKSQGDITARLAVIENNQSTQGKEIVGVQTDVRDLRRGRGFIQPRSDDGINGEYT